MKPGRHVSDDTDAGAEEAFSELSFGCSSYSVLRSCSYCSEPAGCCRVGWARRQGVRLKGRGSGLSPKGPGSLLAGAALELSWGLKGERRRVLEKGREQQQQEEAGGRG